MTKITIHADCADAPKKQLLRDLNIAYAQADVENVLVKFTDDIHWQIIGEFEMRGKAEVREVLEMMKEMVASELVINSIITQGLAGAINGVITTEQGGSVAFCDVCRFESESGARIQSMKSYAIELKMEE